MHNEPARDWLENRLCSMIQKTLAHVAGQSVEVRFVVWNKELDAEDGGPLLQPDPGREKEEHGN